MDKLFNIILYQPILSVLIFFYNLFFHNLGLAIVVLTLIVRIILWPLFYKSAKDQIIMQKLQPHIKKIQLDHKNDRQKQSEELLKLYKENNINPFSSFLLLLIQLPILIALYKVFVQGITLSVFDSLYFIGINLSKSNVFLTIGAGLTQYFQMFLSVKNNRNKTSTYMLWFGTLFTILILSGLPSAVALYWLVSSLVSLLQQALINNKIQINGQGSKNN
ncbi:MAG: YidC/Oxa1 family membrane protein insertase [Minisyncoccia bacterium]